MKALISYALVLSLLSITFPVSVGFAGQASYPSSPAAQRTLRPVDGGWPRAYITATGARRVLHEPQIESWLDQKRMVMYAAVSYTPAGQHARALGTIRVEADTKVAVAERLLSFSDLEITASNFPTLDRDQLKKVVDELTSTIPLEDRVIALDRILAAINTSQITPRNMSGIKSDPPVIFFSERPAVLVNIDGAPIWSPIKENELRDENWKDVRAAVPPKPTGGAAPMVFVSQQPAEMILLNGTAAYVPVQGTELQWVSNTESDVFRIGTTGTVYYVVAGRWFSAPDFTGPWTFATPSLPADLKRIPLEHPRSRVLASVPGTTQALEAVVLAQVPQTARVNRKEVRAPEVLYDGEPQFEAIQQTALARAVNTDKDIIKVGDLYYMCFDGVWFFASSANGPWTVADSVPGDIYQIPISSPAYNVTYVTIEEDDDDDDDWVGFAAESAYSGWMIGWGVAMWGSGYYYPPYLGGGLYPAYYPRYRTYGYGARYNPWTGSYTRAGAVYGPYGGVGYGARYNARTGTYSRGTAAWGPGGARGAAQASNPRTGTYAQTRQGANVYGSWGASAVQRGDQWAATARTTNRATDTTRRVTAGSEGGAMAKQSGPQGTSRVGVTGGGEVYAGRDGNVYRKQGDSWQKYNSGGWQGVDQAVGTGGSAARAEGRVSATTTDQLNRDFNSRSDGAQRTRDYDRVTRSGSGSSLGSGSYRPSGGSFGGGGGARRGGGRR